MCLLRLLRFRRGGEIRAEMKKVILIGDSIRLGYREVVARELSGMAIIWSPDENGGKSRNVLSNLDDWVLSKRPDIVHFNCGLHDLKRKMGKIAVPLDEYREILRAICMELSRLDGCTSIWAATTPVKEDWHHQNKGSDRLEEDVDLYNRAALGVVRDFGLLVNDLFILVERHGRKALLLDDGVHFTAEGYEILGKQVASVIRANL